MSKPQIIYLFHQLFIGGAWALLLFYAIMAVLYFLMLWEGLAETGTQDSNTFISAAILAAFFPLRLLTGRL